MIAIVWLVGWLVTWPAILADAQGRFPTLAERDFRADLGIAMFLAAFPPAWIVVPFWTGFYEYGFQFRRRGTNAQ